jgi:hypothetical protein
MGLINCDKHGPQGIIHLCPHLQERYEEEADLHVNYQKKSDESGMSIYLCDACVERYKFGNVDVLDFDDLQNVGDDLWPVCGKCLI